MRLPKRCPTSHAMVVDLQEYGTLPGGGHVPCPHHAFSRESNANGCNLSSRFMLLSPFSPQSPTLLYQSKNTRKINTSPPDFLPTHDQKTAQMEADIYKK